jgi:hypothetical protein
MLSSRASLDLIGDFELCFQCVQTNARSSKHGTLGTLILDFNRKCEPHFAETMLRLRLRRRCEIGLDRVNQPRIGPFGQMRQAGGPVLSRQTQIRAKCVIRLLIVRRVLEQFERSPDGFDFRGVRFRPLPDCGQSGHAIAVGERCGNALKESLDDFRAGVQLGAFGRYEAKIPQDSAFGLGGKGGESRRFFGHFVDRTKRRDPRRREMRSRHRQLWSPRARFLQRP